MLTCIFVLVVLGSTDSKKGAGNFVGQALSDLWVFIVGPFVGAAIAAGIWKIIGEEK